MNTKTQSQPAAAFTLVELALALGIVSFAMVSIFGLVPIGLQASRDSSDQIARTNITKQIASEAQLTDFDKLADLTKSPYYFDADGVRCAKAESRYSASASLRTSTDIPGTGSEKWNSVALIELEITSVSNAKPTTHFVHVVDLRKK